MTFARGKYLVEWNDGPGLMLEAGEDLAFERGYVTVNVNEGGTQVDPRLQGGWTVLGNAPPNAGDRQLVELWGDEDLLTILDGRLNDVDSALGLRGELAADMEGDTVNTWEELTAHLGDYEDLGAAWYCGYILAYAPQGQPFPTLAEYPLASSWVKPTAGYPNQDRVYLSNDGWETAQPIGDVAGGAYEAGLATKEFSGGIYDIIGGHVISVNGGDRIAVAMIVVHGATIALINTAPRTNGIIIAAQNVLSTEPDYTNLSPDEPFTLAQRGAMSDWFTLHSISNAAVLAAVDMTAAELLVEDRTVFLAALYDNFTELA